MRLIFFCLIISFSTCAQSKESVKYWMALNYLNRPINTAVRFDIKTNPIMGILVNGNSIEIMLYCGEFNPLTKLSEIGEGKRFEIKNITTKLNLECYSRNEFSNTKFYLTKVNNQFIIEVEKGKDIRKFNYVSNFEGYELEKPQKVNSRLSLQGEYTINNSTLSGNTIIFKMNGAISGWTDWLSYNVISSAQNLDHNYYDIITLTSPQGVTKEFAMTNGKDIVNLYSFEYLDPMRKYDIKVNQRPIYSLSKSK
ncbi:MAG TPA: hypothetical protein VD794_11040 [Flavisolibacter sp.]|nr:hypothetical protein [Flavisolibacter sp.]